MHKQSDEDAVKALFDEWARSGRAEGMELGHAATARAAFETLGLTASSRFLDVGCGNGYAVRWAAVRCPKGSATGVDLSPAMIARARAQSDHIENARFEALSFPDDGVLDGPFDCIVAVESFYYLPDLDAAFARVRELLKPGGVFACAVGCYRENAASHAWPEELGVPLHVLSASGWRGAMEIAGLHVADQRRVLSPALRPGEEWKEREGSLLTVGRRRA